MLVSLPGFGSIQPHKSYIVIIKAIRSVEANIFNIGAYQVPFSRHLKDEVMQRL